MFRDRQPELSGRPSLPTLARILEARAYLDTHDATVKLEHSDTRLINVHSPEACEGRPCPLHNRTDHSMRAQPQIWRGDRHIIERICPHGVGHPDPDDTFADPIHGCDGCCVPNKEP